jgi:predicted DNA-binding transcriptional regulator AlpA
MSAKPPVPSYKSPLEIVRRVELRAILGGCSNHHLDDLERQEAFPRRIRLGSRSVGWIRGEVQDWLAMRMRERDEALAHAAVKPTVPRAPCCRLRREREAKVDEEAGVPV